MQFRFDNLEGGAAPVGDAARSGGVDGDEAAYCPPQGLHELRALDRASEVRIFEHGRSVQAEPLAWPVPVERTATRSGSPSRSGSRRRCASSRTRAPMTRRAVRRDRAAAAPVRGSRDRPRAAAPSTATRCSRTTARRDPSTRNIPLGNASAGAGARERRAAEPQRVVAGAPVPGRRGNFVARWCCRRGAHTVEVAVLDEQGNGSSSCATSS